MDSTSAKVKDCGVQVAKAAAWVCVAVVIVTIGIELVYFMSARIAARIEDSKAESMTEATTIVGTVFSILGFGGLLYTIMLQRKELHALEADQADARRKKEKGDEREFQLAYFNAAKTLTVLTDATQSLPQNARADTVRLLWHRVMARDRLQHMLRKLNESFAMHYPDAGKDNPSTYTLAIVVLLSAHRMLELEIDWIEFTNAPNEDFCEELETIIAKLSDLDIPPIALADLAYAQNSIDNAINCHKSEQGFQPQDVAVLRQAVLYIQKTIATLLNVKILDG